MTSNLELVMVFMLILHELLAEEPCECQWWHLQFLGRYKSECFPSASSFVASQQKSITNWSGSKLGTNSYVWLAHPRDVNIYDIFFAMHLSLLIMSSQRSSTTIYVLLIISDKSYFMVMNRWDHGSGVLRTEILFHSKLHPDKKCISSHGYFI